MERGNCTVNALSFDIEDWFHMLDLPQLADPQRWDTLESLVQRYTEHILAILSDYDVRATFFVVGWVAERYPELAPMIAQAGHEVASHSYWHRSVHRLDPQTFADDLDRSVAVLEDQTGMRVRGFRAPGFTLTPAARWTLDVMLDRGLQYDASVDPGLWARFGASCPRQPHEITLPSGRAFRELPISVAGPGRWGMKYCGGGYLRLLPQWMMRCGIDAANRANRPAVIYLHPRDLAVDCPRIDMPLSRRFRCYVGLKSAEAKLRGLLSQYPFDTCAAVLGIEPAHVRQAPAMPHDSVRRAVA